MFQDARLLPWLTVEQNLRLAVPPGTDVETGCILRLVGLEGWNTAYPRRLSGGMAQRAALARALCRKPEILLLDEPFGALDAFTRSRLRRDLDELWRSLGITVILVTHDIEEAVYLADRVVRMKSGSIEGSLDITPPPRTTRPGFPEHLPRHRRFYLPPIKRGICFFRRKAPQFLWRIGALFTGKSILGVENE
jgi:ABC-type nitrate/sulfonate/bicarbonate transport system ATPase subunit